jgi:II/X family phage/plasmid replication protein
MIDYIDVVVPMKNNGFIRKGYKTITKEDGSESKSNYPLYVHGRNGSTIKILSLDTENVRIIGSPSMFIQGQNVYGTDDLVGLCCRVFNDIAEKLGIEPSKKNRRQWMSGDFTINTLDVTHNFILPSQSTVCEWMDQAARSLGSGKQPVETFRASSSSHIETAYVGRSSNYISVKFYNKYRQMIDGVKNQRKNNEADWVMQKLVESAKDLLRCEIRFHKQYLNKYGLTLARNLTSEVIWEHYEAKLKKISLGSSKILPVQELEGLNNSQRLAYQLWLKGGNVKHGMPPATFERICRKLHTLGVNIRRPFVDQVEGKSLRFYLKWGKVAQAPDFLIQSPWYFCPDKTLIDSQNKRS